MTRPLSDRSSERLLLTRLWIIAAFVRVLKYVLPLPRLVALAAAPIVTRPSGDRIESLRRLAQAAPEGTRLPGNCLERSLGLFHLLIAAGAAPQLAVGLKRGAGRLIDGHVWVELEGTPFGETVESLAPFERLVDFDAHGRSVPVAVQELPTAR